MPEELALNQLRRNRRAVEGDKRPCRPVAFFVQRACYKFLAGSGFTIDADTRFARCHALNLRHHAAHGFAGEDQCMLAHASTQVAILGFETRELQRIFNCHQQFFGGEGLLKKIERAQPSGAHSHLDVRLAAHHNHRRGHARRLEVFKQ